MRVRTLLATSVSGLLLAGTSGLPASADPSIVADTKSGHLALWGASTASVETTVPASLNGKQVVGLSLSDNATGAITADGQLTVWGKSGATSVSSAPAGLTDLTQLSMGTTNAVALKEDGSVVAWGSASGIDAVPAGLTAKAVAISGAGGTAYAVRTDGTLTYWGTTPSALPPTGLANLVDVSATTTFALALDATGNVTVWGALAGSLAVPAAIQGHVKQIATGGTVAGAILDDGSIKLWGLSAPTATIPAALTGKTVVSLDVNANAIAATSDGKVYAWGPSTGNNPAINTVPASLATESIAAVAISGFHAGALVTDFRALAPPTIAGDARIGQTLTATPATLSLAPDAPATGQWLADGAELAGETGTTLDVDESMVGKELSYRTSATRGTTTVESTSDEVGPVAKLPSTTTLVVTPADDDYGTARTATATVTKESGTPTGNVTFTLGATQATVALTGGTATWALPTTLGVGTHQVTAAYAGDASTVASTSTPATVVVHGLASSTALTVSPATGGYGTTRTATATVTSAGTPTGNVTFTVGATQATVALTGGTATWTLPATLAVGTHQVTAGYGGDSNTDASISDAKTVTVTAIASSTALTVSPATGEYGGTRTATATVTRTGGTPTGTVTFALGGTQATATLSGGKATWTLPATLAVGTHQVTATYGGDATTGGSASTAATLTVAKATSTLTAGKPKLKGKTKKLVKKTTFTLTVQTPSGVSPAGTVVLTLKGGPGTGKAKKVTVQVNDKGVATVVVKKLKHSTYTATWDYAGSATVAGATLEVKKLKI